MNTQPATTSDDTPRCPETVGDRDDQGDPRQLAPEADDEVEEAGYGYGV